jgi:hypothetical protein
MAHVVLKLEFKTGGEGYGCLAKRSMVFAGCDVVAALNRLISNNHQTL